MVNKRWSLKAYESLKGIFEYYKDVPEYGRIITSQIIDQIDDLKYPEQHQIDDIICAPYRRIILKQYRIIYKVTSPSDIEILQIFSNRQSPKKIKREFKK